MTGKHAKVAYGARGGDPRMTPDAQSSYAETAVSSEWSEPSGGAGVRESGNIVGIRLLYESKDGRLCVFEDAQGHLAAVRASKLA